MNITDVRVRKMMKESNLKAVASITIDDDFVVHDIKVVEGEKGLFIAMPSRKGADGEYRDIAHPINSQTRDELQQKYLSEQADIDAQAQKLLAQNITDCRKFLTEYSVNTALQMLERWKELGTYLIMKFNDQVVKKEKDGKWELTEDGICVSTERPGYPEQYRQTIAKETGDRYMVPNQK